MTPSPSWLDRARQLLTRSFSPTPHELNELDWKLELSPNKERLAEHLSAFSNHTDGGFMVYGINANGEVQGVSPQESEKIITQLGNIARDGLEPSQRIQHYSEVFQGKPLLFVHIPESEEKPVSLRGKGYEFAYMRSGGQTRRMKQEDLSRAILQSRHLRYEELEALSCSIADIPEYLEIKAWMDLLKKPDASDDAVIDALVNEKMIYRNGDRCVISNLGAIVAAGNLQLFPGKERFSVRVIKYSGASRVNAIEEREFEQGYAVEFQNLIRSVVSMLPTSEVIKDALRKTVPVYPEITVRELVANALVHRDFTITSSHPTIEIFIDRMEIINPGKLLPSVKIDRLIDTTPESRNELLAKIMRRMGICEERGSGIDRALFEVELYGLPPVQFEELDNHFKVTLFSPRTFKQMSPAERLRACYQHCCLRYVAGDKMTSASLRNRLGLNARQNVQAWKIVSEGIKQHLIKLADPQNKSKKFASYVPYWA